MMTDTDYESLANLRAAMAIAVDALTKARDLKATVESIRPTTPGVSVNADRENTLNFLKVSIKALESALSSPEASRLRSWLKSWEGIERSEGTARLAPWQRPTREIPALSLPSPDFDPNID